MLQLGLAFILAATVASIAFASLAKSTPVTFEMKGLDNQLDNVTALGAAT